MIQREIVISGSRASQNPFPDFSGYPPNAYKLPGEFGGILRDPGIRITDDELTQGLLFLGGAGSGKTNTMMWLAGQILDKLGPKDVAVFFDMKGDYKETFCNDGDAYLSITDGTFTWNLFDEFLPILDDEGQLEIRIGELCDNLYHGQESAQQPYFVNAAKAITKDLILYLLQKAKQNSCFDRLNNGTLKRLILGPHSGNANSYDLICNILLSDPRFSGERAFMPPREETYGDTSYAVLSEIVIMANRVLAGAFGDGSNTNSYISPSGFAIHGGGHALFLEYNPALPEIQIPAFRLFVDNLIADRAELAPSGGKTYLFLDEFAMLPELQYLDRALDHFRSRGFCVIAGLQSIEQVNHRYPGATAKIILEAFQSVIAFRCENSSITWLQEKTGRASVQQVIDEPGGNLSYSSEANRPCIEDWEVLGLRRGEAFVKLGNRPVFKYQFCRNVGIRS